MKHCKDYKKLYSFLLLGALLMTPLFFVSGQSATDIQNKISQRNSDIGSLQQEIKQYQAQLDDLGKQKDSLAGSIAELDISRKKLNADIAVTQNKIDNANSKIDDLGSQIGTKQDSITNATDAIALNIKNSNEYEQSSLVETILSDNDFTTAWNDLDNMATIEKKIEQNILQLKQVKGQLEDTKTQTIAVKDELTTLRSQLADQKKIIEQNTIAKNKLLTDTKNNESNYQKLLRDRLAQKEALEKEVQDYESQLKYILDPKSLPQGGVLSWPLDSVFITTLFGKNTNTKIYASGMHNGVDFRASVGTPVKAMSSGVVGGTGDTDIECRGVSFGRFVFIKYDNGLASTYGHLSLIKAVKGQSVQKGDIVGYSGNTGYSTGPHLHVSVYARDAVDVQNLPSKACKGKVLTQPIAPTAAYLDPLFYLPKANASMYKASLNTSD